MVGGVAGRHFRQQRIDVRVGERLTAHLAWLAVLDQGDGLVGQQIELIGLLAQEDVDERIEACWHRLFLGTSEQHVRAVHVMRGIVSGEREERLGRLVQVVEQPGMVLGGLEGGDAL